MNYEERSCGVKPANFLILGVQPIIKASDGQHDDAFSCHILEGFGDGDGAALTDEIRIHVKNCARANILYLRIMEMKSEVSGYLYELSAI